MDSIGVEGLIWFAKLDRFLQQGGRFARKHCLVYDHGTIDKKDVSRSGGLGLVARCERKLNRQSGKG